jgi:hypothetical protein
MNVASQDVHVVEKVSIHVAAEAEWVVSGESEVFRAVEGNDVFE